MGWLPVRRSDEIRCPRSFGYSLLLLPSCRSAKCCQGVEDILSHGVDLLWCFLDSREGDWILDGPCLALYI